MDELELYLKQHEDVLTFDRLLSDASQIVATYMTTWSADRASETSNHAQHFPVGQPWTSPSSKTAKTRTPVPPAGDSVLRNTILRMRDSMLHYEFQSAIADGDIGRAMNVMAVSNMSWSGSFT